MMVSPTYQCALEHQVSEKFWAMMTAPNSGPTLIQYCKEMHIIVQKLSNMNTHVVLDDTKLLALILLKNKTLTKKYTNTEPINNKNDNEEKKAIPIMPMMPMKIMMTTIIMMTMMMTTMMMKTKMTKASLSWSMMQKKAIKKIKNTQSVPYAICVSHK